MPSLDNNTNVKFYNEFDIKRICLVGYNLKHILLENGKIDRNSNFNKCGIVPFQRQPLGIVNWSSPRAARIAGIVYCDCHWICPLCGLQYMLRRAAEIDNAIAEWHRQAGHTSMLTLTLPHTKDDRLEDLFDLMGKCQNLFWNTVVRKQLLGPGYRGERVVFKDITYSHGHGWHLHYHVVVFHKSTSIQVFRKALKDVWLKILSDHARTGSPRHAIQADSLSSANYFLKGYYAPSGDSDNTSLFELASKVAKGNARCMALYSELISATRGRHRLQWSESLKKLLQPNDNESRKKQRVNDKIIFHYADYINLPFEQKAELHQGIAEGNVEKVRHLVTESPTSQKPSVADKPPRKRRSGLRKRKGLRERYEE